MLSPRQEELYQDTFDIWRPVVSNSPQTALAGTEYYTKIASNVAGYLQLEPNVNEPSVAGRIQRKIIYTMDLIHFDRDQEIDADYIVKNTSRNEDDTPGRNYGRFWRVLGQARSFNSRVDREMGKQSVLASSELEPPAGVE
jgi:hypothetical protein